MIVHCRVDGVTTATETAPEHSLMHLIGDGQERSCRDGSCLRCLVMLGERVVLGCKTPAYRAQGTEITTPNGLDQRPEYHDVMKAFRKVGLAECVETEPYLVLLAFHILSESETPAESALHNLSRHLNDRCSNREDFERAVRIAAGLRRRRDHGHS